jgi:FAD/FMN-containing dehydrogenase
MIDRHPAVIVRCSSAEDVARSITFARAHGTAIAIRGGGHNGGGLGAVEDGIVIDLAGTAEIVVGPSSDSVRVGGGCTWGRSMLRPLSTAVRHPRESSQPPASAGSRSAAESAT